MTGPPDPQLVAELERLHDVTNDAGAILYVRDADDRYVWVCETYGRLLPFTREQVIGKTNRELFGADAARNWEVADSFARATHDFMTTAEQLYDKRTKRWRKFISTKMVIDIGGKPYLVGISVEVTGPHAEAYERHLGEIRGRILAHMGHPHV